MSLKIKVNNQENRNMCDILLGTLRTPNYIL
jgi:hypothetical protein